MPLKKNILFIHQASELYGSDKVLLYIVSSLQAGTAYHPIVVIPSSGPLERELLKASVEVHVAEVVKISRRSFTPKGILSVVRGIAHAVRAIDRVVDHRDVSIVHSNTLAVLGGVVWALVRRKIHIWHVHEIVCSPRWVSRAYAIMLGLFADAIICNSRETQQWLIKTRPSIADKTIVAFNGLPDDYAKGTRITLNSGIVPGARVTAVLAGRINAWKGHLLLVEAAAILLAEKSLDGVKFLIVGDSPPGKEYLVEQLRLQIHRAGLDDYFEFIAFVDDIREIWALADIAVVPSTEPEPFGMVAIEAMACGVPVIGAGHGGLLDIIVDGHSGFVFPPRCADGLARALKTLIEGRILRSQMGISGKSRQRSMFSVDAQVRVIQNVYADIYKSSLD